MISIELVEKTIYESFREQVDYAPDQLALEYEEEIFSWKDLDELSDKVAIVFMRKGVGKGSHVGIWSENSPNWFITFFSLTKIGAIPVLINTCYKEQELLKIAQYADIEFICYGDGFKEQNYEEILKTITSHTMLQEEKCIAIGMADDGKWKGLKESYLSITEEEINQLGEHKKSVSIHDTAAMFFTSGTTKLPKGVILSHYSLVNNSLEIARNMRWTSRDKMCIAVPMFHCFGVTASLLAAIHVGCSIHLLKYCSSSMVMKKVNHKKCTILNGVPTMFLAMMHNKNHRKYDLSSVKSGIIAGSHISANDYIKLCKTFGFTHLQPSYGQTEASPCITIADYNDPIKIKAKTVGKVIDNVALRIYKQRGNKELERGKIGEIQTKGYHVMKSYYKLSTETKKAIDEEGWLSTGDIGYLDSQGYLHITGRMSEMIIRGGENISPIEIEESIQCIHKVKEVKVIGIEGDVLQEEIVACIIPVEGEEIEEEEIKEFVGERLSHYKVPKYVLVFQDFPHTASGKVMLQDLKRKVIERINQKNKEDQICFLLNNMS